MLFSFISSKIEKEKREENIQMNLKMPYGISNYEKIVNNGYYYVDKTMYIEKLENLPEIL